MENEIDGACGRYGGEMHKRFWWGNWGLGTSFRT